MNWHHWHRELSYQAELFENYFHEYDDCFPGLLAKSCPPPAALLFVEGQSRGEIDLACRYFAAKARWPSKLGPKEKMLIYIRVKVAEEHAIEQAHQQPVRVQSSAELNSERDAALTQLLVDYWIPKGRAEWLRRSK